MKRKCYFKYSVFIIIALIISLWCVLKYNEKNNVSINEVCAKHTSFGDYIELYNNSIFPVSLEGLFLTDTIDNIDNKRKIDLSGRKIKGKDYLVIFLDNEDVFFIDRMGETLYLTDENNAIIDEVTVPILKEDSSYSRSDSGQWIISECSPWKSNATQNMAVVEPTFSAKSGFYESPFFLEMTTGEDSRIYYTLDGSVPDEQSTLYTGPIYVYDRSPEENLYRNIPNFTTDWDPNYYEEPVEKAFVVRAIAVSPDSEKSDVVSATYFIDKDEWKDETVVSLLVNPEDFFGENGIYVTGKEYDDWYLSGKEGESPLANYYQGGLAMEREATLDFFQGEHLLQQQIGTRIQGGSNRWKRLKRLSLFSRKEYSGIKYFDMELIDGVRSHSVVLRESFANAFLNVLVEDRSVGTLKGIPVKVFLNGEFWYDTYMLEKYSRATISQKYAVDEDNLIVAKDRCIEYGEEDDIYKYLEIITCVDTYFDDAKDGYQRFNAIVDTQSLIDYYCINIYLCNLDVNPNKNCLSWRVKEPGDGKYNDGRWRWLLYDLDAIEWSDPSFYGVTDLSEVNAFKVRPQYCEESLEKQKAFSMLLRSEDFCRQFVLTFMDLVNYNFEVNRVTQKLQEWGEEITWNNSFFEKRPYYAVKHLAEQFELKGSLEEVKISVSDTSAGYIRLNTITPELVDGEWSGDYFTDYPVTVTAVPEPGYEFVGWSGEIESTKETVEVPVKKGGIQIHAVFRKR